VTTISKAGPREYMGYVRVSQVKGRDSEENRDRFHSPDVQLDRIKQSIESAGGTYVDFKYDPNRSGYQNIIREGWNEAVAWVMEDPKRRGIVAYDTSRLSRSLWRLLGDIQHTMVPAGARVIVAGEGIDTATPNWVMALQMAGIMAEQFSIKMGERWQEVHERRIRRNQSPVGKVPYGYRRMPERIDPDTGTALPSLGIEPDPVTAPLLRRMYRMYIDGMGLRLICLTLNDEADTWEAMLADLTEGGGPCIMTAEDSPAVAVASTGPSSLRAPKGGPWSTTSLTRILRNPAAIGKFTFKGHSRKTPEGESVEPLPEPATSSDGPTPTLVPGVDDPSLIDGGWEAVLDVATWDQFRRAANKKAKVGKAGNRKDSSGWTLAGIARCGHCGGRLTVNYLPLAVEPGDYDVEVPVPKGHAKRRGMSENATWSLAESKVYKNKHSSAMCSTYRSQPGECKSGVFMLRSVLEYQVTMFLGTMQQQIGNAAVGKADEERDAARADAAQRAEQARGELQQLSDARVSLSLQKALGEINEAEHRAAKRRLDSMATAAQERLTLAEAGVDASEPLSEVWDQLATGGENMSAQAWNQVLRRVLERVEVDDEHLLFVPTVGKPVKWKRHTVSRGAQTRRNRQRKHVSPEQEAWEESVGPRVVRASDEVTARVLAHGRFKKTPDA
jgi:DNA invertase Pin-like site-specific DNA recombinase